MKAMYSPNQLIIGTYIGGPLAAMYFLKSNFEGLGRMELAKKTLLLGLLVALLVFAIMPFVPESPLSGLIPILYLVPVYFIVKKHQLSKPEISESKEYIFQSNWKVAGMTIVWMIVSMIVGIAIMFAFASLGVITFE